MTARTTMDSCPFVTELDVIEDQDVMSSVVPEDREQLAIAVTMTVADAATNSLAHWMTCDEALWPVTDGETVRKYNDTCSAWNRYVETGSSRIDWFRTDYKSSK